MSTTPDRITELRETAQITAAIRKGLDRRWSDTVPDARLVGLILGALDEAGFMIAPSQRPPNPPPIPAWLRPRIVKKR